MGDVDPKFIKLMSALRDPASILVFILVQNWRKDLQILTIYKKIDIASCIHRVFIVFPSCNPVLSTRHRISIVYPSCCHRVSIGYDNVSSVFAPYHIRVYIECPSRMIVLPSAGIVHPSSFQSDYSLHQGPSGETSYDFQNWPIVSPSCLKIGIVWPPQYQKMARRQHDGDTSRYLRVIIGLVV